MPLLFLLLSLVHSTTGLKCYDCTNCPYPWSSFGVETYGSMSGIFSRVQSCCKKEFYSAIDRRLDRVARGAIDRDCQAGKLESSVERSIAYCCYSNYCNGTVSRQVANDRMMTTISLSIIVVLILRR